MKNKRRGATKHAHKATRRSAVKSKASAVRSVTPFGAVGRLRSLETSEPLAGVTVRAFEILPAGQSRALGSDKTNDQGLFTIVYAAPETGAVASDATLRFIRLRLEISPPDSDDQYETEILVRIGEDRVLDVPVPFRQHHERKVRTIRDIATVAPDVTLPDDLLSTLADRGITTLDDVRRVGGVRTLADLPLPADAPALRAIDAIADLGRIAPATLAASLLNAGTRSVSEVAAAPRDEFVARAGDLVGDVVAAGIHASAVARTAFLNNVIANVRVADATRSRPVLPENVQLPEPLRPSCGCKDCQAAVSPLAYLADLLDYTVDHLRSDGNPITLGFLKNTFHQPFGDLPASCSAAEERVRQVRLCIEVLRRYLRATNLPASGSAQRAALDAAERSYVLEAYRTLLTKIGTSFDELRLAAPADTKTKQALAERLGVELGTGSATNLDKLTLDPNAASTQPNALTESALETLFGLPVTTRIDSIAPAPAASALRTMRLAYLRSAWKKQDWASDAYAKKTRPIIDPNVIGPADLRTPTAGDPAYDVWKTRHDTQVVLLANLASDRVANGLDSILTSTLQKVYADLVPILADLQASATAAAAAVKVKQMNLTVDSFTRLMEIAAKQATASAAEWSELYAILAQVEKEKQRTTWLQDEAQRNVLLGPEHFWIALQEPQLDKWLASVDDRSEWQQALRDHSAAPTIDPNVIGPADLKNPKVGDAAYDLWAARDSWVKGRTAAIKTLRQSGTTPLAGLDSAVQQSLGVPASTLIALRAQRDAGTDITPRLDQLTLPRDAFARLLRLRDLVVAGSTLSNREWEDVDAILTQVEKRRRFARWRVAEEQAGVVLSSDYFRVPDTSSASIVAPLPAWLATWSIRRDWRDDLEARIGQESTVADALRTSIGETEEATLSALRDALVQATDAAGFTLDERATWATKRLMIDCKAAACQMTTRVTQAIETIQGVLFATRTGQLHSQLAKLTLSAPDYDEEQKWMGSYASWRAAMFVFLYPDNIAQPSLRQKQTPAFRELVASLRANRRLTPADACAAAQRYAEYFEDVCRLQLEGCAEATTRLEGKGCSIPAAAGTRQLQHLIGRSAGSNRVYWSYSDLGASSPKDSQSFWQELVAFKDVKQVIGIAVYEQTSRERHLYVFAITMDAGVQKLVFVRYDLERGGWQQEQTELEAPEKAEAFTANLRVTAAASPPQIIFRLLNGKVYSHSLNVKGADWESGDPTEVKVLGSWRHMTPGASGLSPDGSFACSATAVSARFAVSGDFDGDGRREVAIAIAGQGSVGNDFWVMQFDPATRVWQHMSPTGNPSGADFDCGAATVQARAAVAGDFDGDGRDEIAITASVTGREGNDLWVMDYDPLTKSWRHLGPNSLSGIGADIQCSTDNLTAVDNTLVVGDFDGDKRHEIALAIGPRPNVTSGQPDVDDNEFWVMKYTAGAGGAIGTWTPLNVMLQPPSFIPNPRRAAFRCDDESFPVGVKFAVAGDFNGDGRDEIAIAIPKVVSEPEYSFMDATEESDGNDFWVMRYVSQQAFSAWTHVDSVTTINWRNTRVTPDFSCAEASSMNPTVQAKFAVVGDFDGDQREEIAIAPDTAGALGNQFWVMKFVSAGAYSGNWNSLGSSADYSPHHFSFGCTSLSGALAFSARFAVVADVDGDHRDEIVVAPDVTGNPQQSRGNDFWVMDFTPPYTWGHLTPTSHEFGADFDCTGRQVAAAGFAVAGDFDADQRVEIAIPIAGTGGGLTNEFWAVELHDGLAEVCKVSDAVPSYAGPWDISERMSDADRAARRQRTQTLLTTATSRPNRAYFEEAWYFVPVQIALALQQRGHYTAALDWYRTVLDYTAPFAARKVYYGLVEEESLSTTLDRPANWLLDALDVHTIAASRLEAYTRFTLLSEIRCLLDFADAEFTADTSESVPRARTLYMTALDLLDWPVVKPQVRRCEALVQGIRIQVGDPYWEEVFRRLKNRLTALEDEHVFRSAIEAVNAVIASAQTLAAKYARVSDIVARAEDDASREDSRTLESVIGEKRELVATAHAALLTFAPIAASAERAGTDAATRVQRKVAAVAGLTSTMAVAPNIRLPWLREPMLTLTVEPMLGAAMRDIPRLGDVPLRDGYAHLGHGGNGGNGGNGSRWNGVDLDAIALPRRAELEAFDGPTYSYVPAPVYSFCIPPNPVISALRLRAELNLFKLRHCRNIAGMERELEMFAAPTDTTSGLPTIGTGGQLVLPGATTLRPTPYRYIVLVERAKQLVALSQQIEAAFLAALEKRDAEYYSLMRAKQDVRLTRASVRLQDLRVREAEGSVKLAQLQQERATLQADHFKRLIEEPQSENERAALDWMKAAIGWQYAASGANAIAALLHGAGAVAYGQMGNSAGALSETAAAIAASSGSLSSLAGAASTWSSYLSTQASYERRLQDWEYQRNLALADVGIAAQQTRIADDHVRVAGQERVIAELQSDHAEAIADFLGTKFTNVELYDWMAGVLERVYGFFLQQATAVARLASNQLAFERQMVPPSFIQNDYWEVPDENSTGAGKSVDRRGMTGSARLLQDIWQLDQYAFETNKRRLQLTKTLSLARMGPAEFESFRRTGVLTFSTTMELFDRDFPGHYLRLIRRVRTSVIALTPPSHGIRATLSNRGTTRAVIRGDTFQTVVVRRDPETVALSSARDATGLFELEPQTEMLLPFEGLGVDGTWELRLPKAANAFDFRTIADVLLTVEYTAENDFSYQQQVLQQLDPEVRADRAFSFRHELADAWYDLHNPDQSSTPMIVKFSMTRDDFPPNLDAMKLQHVALYFSRADGESMEIPVTYLRFAGANGGAAVGGGATTIDGMISTRRGNAGAWIPMTGRSPFGEWELALPTTATVKDYFKEEQISDILLVISYGAETPAWPA
jgi:hypothetical protein